MPSSFRRCSSDRIRDLVFFFILIFGCVSGGAASTPNDQIIQGLIADRPVQPFESVLPEESDRLPNDPQTHPAEVGGDAWWNTVLERLNHEAKSARCEDGTCRTHLASQGVTYSWDEDGVEASLGKDSLKLQVSAWGRHSEWIVAEPVAPRLGACQEPLQLDVRGQCLRRVEYKRPGINEWWTGAADGMEQGWTLSERPVGDGDVAVALRVSGAQIVSVDSDGQEAIFETQQGQRLRYGKLLAWDVEGRVLASRMAQESGRLVIRVDDEGARYPIVIDPVLGAADADAIAQPDGVAWRWVDSADVNGDGFADVLLSAINVGCSGCDRAYVFHGSATGVSTVADSILESDGNSFARLIQGLGDVNGDGYDDVAIPRQNGVWVFHGSTSGLASGDASSSFDFSANFSMQRAEPLGDVDGDGYGDVAFQAQYRPNCGCREVAVSRVYVYLGSSTGLTTSGRTSINYPDDGSRCNCTPIGAFSCSILVCGFGNNISVGDFDNDGETDLAITSSGYNRDGRVYVYEGTGSGFNASPDATFNVLSRERPSSAVSGDFDGDGFDDVALGSARNGTVRILEGSSAGLINATTLTLSGPSDANGDAGSFGLNAFKGDFNADGLDDLAVTADQFDLASANRAGRVYVHLGNSGSGLETAASTILEGSGVNERLGRNTARPGDFDGDGTDDVAVLSGTDALVFTGLYGPSSSLTADFGVDLTLGPAPLVVQFTSLASASGTTITSWQWDFDGDGTIDSTDENPVHVYLAPGVYDVTLTVSDGDLIDSRTRVAYVEATASIQADFAVDATFGPAPLTVQFTALVNANGTTVTSWQWDFDNDGVVDSTDENPSHTYTAEGTYSVSLRVSDGSIATQQLKVDLITVSAVVAEGNLDEGSGISVSLGPGLDGVLVGDATWGSGQQGSGLAFDGGYAEFVDPGADWSLDVEDALSIALWIRPDDLGGNQVLLSKDNAYELELGKLGDTAWNVRFNNQVQGQASSPIVEGVWQHVVVTWDGTTVRYYYNGQPDGSDAFSGTLDTNNANVGLGARPSPANAGGPTFFFFGAMDEVRVYQRALTDAEVADLFGASVSDVTPPVLSAVSPFGPLAAGTTSTQLAVTSDETAMCRYAEMPGTSFGDMTEDFDTTGSLAHTSLLGGLTDDTIHQLWVRCQDALGNANTSDTAVLFTVGESDLMDGLAAFWSLDEGSGCDAFDLAGSHDGTLEPDCPGGNAPTWAAGAIGSGLSFDGFDDVVRVPAAPGLDAPAAVTVSAWIRQGPGDWAAILDKRDGGTDGYNLYLSNTGQLAMRINDQLVIGTATVADNQWHHVTGVFDGGNVTLYVDGQVDQTQAVGAQTLSTSADVLLGRNFASTNFSFSGTLDEVTVHSRALSDIEVFGLYAAFGP